MQQLSERNLETVKVSVDLVGATQMLSLPLCDGAN